MNTFTEKQEKLLRRIAKNAPGAGNNYRDAITLYSLREDGFGDLFNSRIGGQNQYRYYLTQKGKDALAEAA